MGLNIRQGPINTEFTFLPYKDDMERRTFLKATGGIAATAALNPNTLRAASSQIEHIVAGGRVEVDNGLMDGFMKTSAADAYAIGYYQEADNQFLSQFARNFTACDMYFPSILAPTFPNRIFQLCGQTDRLDDSVSLCSYRTVFDHCTAPA